jgi:hypothetical protein
LFVVLLCLGLALYMTADTFLLSVSQYGANQAASVAKGKAELKPLPVPHGSGSLRALDIEAAIATVDWLDKRPASVGPKDCLMFLGSVGGVVVLWDVSGERLVRAPTSSAVVTTTSAPSCGKL